MTAYRRGPKLDSNSDRNGRIITVRLARRSLRDQLLKSARVRKTATTAGMNLSRDPTTFNLNERLTQRNYKLFQKAREIAKLQKWSYVWTSVGQVLLRQKEGQPAHRVKNLDDLSTVFGVSLC